MEIKKYRKRIDAIDSRILRLLNERARVTLDIGRAKARKGHSIYVPDREKGIYKRLGKMNKGPLSDKAVEAIYREIMSGSLALEKPITVAFFGPEATFTHIAALKKFGQSLEYNECKSISEVFTEVERGRSDYGVVPIENSTEGAVNHTLDMFVDSDLAICSEIYLSIELNLLSSRKNMKYIKKIYSHQQVFAQCRMWLETHMPNVPLITAPSTTEAAIQAGRTKGAGAIASRLAAEKYGLNILARGIQDSSHNITRFLVIGRQHVRQTSHDKTSVLFTMQDKAGALHDMLMPFKKNRVNLTKIESRPSKKKAWKYYFYVDLDGHKDDSRVKKALAALKKKALLFKVLGSYPKAQ